MTENHYHVIFVFINVFFKDNNLNRSAPDQNLEKIIILFFICEYPGPIYLAKSFKGFELLVYSGKKF